MSRNDSDIFYQEIALLDGSFKTNAFTFKKTFNTIKLGCITANMSFVINGPDDTAGISDGTIKPGDGLVTLENVHAGRIAVKGVAAASVRIWAY